jgi:transcriptional regulator with XRE-family HTH domain
LESELRDSAFREAYEELEEEFAIAKQIIRLRKARGWTQRELAERAHTSQPAIARLESGSYRNLSLTFLRKLGRALGAVPVVHMEPVDGGSLQHA